MGKDKRQKGEEELPKGVKVGAGKAVTPAAPAKGVAAMEIRHILVEKQKLALEVLELIAVGKKQFNEAVRRALLPRTQAHFSRTPGAHFSMPRCALRPLAALHGRLTLQAREFSLDKAGRSGLLGWKRRDELDPVFWEAALLCKEGEFLPEPVHTQWGWHIIMVQSKK